MISSLILFPMCFALRFKEDLKVVTEADDTLHFQLICESPRDGQAASFTFQTLNGDRIVLAESKNSANIFDFKVPGDFAGLGMAEIVAESETGSKCSATIFIK